MKAIRLVLAGTAAALAVTVSAHNTLAQPNPEPMIFFVAKGVPTLAGRAAANGSRRKERSTS